MDVIVCVKQVPEVIDADLKINKEGTGIEKEDLVMHINDWDNYAVEEAVCIKEAQGGTVTAITIGDDESEDVLRRALAMGADKAIRIDPGERELDGFVISKILAKVIKDLEYDLVLTGVQADDDNSGMVGVMLAEELGLSHAAVVTGVQPEGDDATIRVELEGGMDEIAKIQLPSLLTVQTGINEPRYVSIMGIRKARNKELALIELEELDLSEDHLTPMTLIEEVFLPPETTGAEMIEGDASSVAAQLIKIIKEKGVSI
jgi:electron transfer flavoprotein beta subunit